MKVSLNWLTDYVDISISADELSKVLTNIGLNVEEIIETDSDIVLDLEVTSNRPDCLGHLGVAREIAAVTAAELRPPVIGDLPTVGKVSDLTSVEVEAPDLCPRYTARVLRGIKIGPSPQWMVERLEAVGVRSINNVVDVTNYVLMEYSQPLHSFDYDKLAGHRIVVRRGLPGETMVSIDETTCRLDEDMLIIADAERPVAIAGIMGGLESEVSDATTNLLIEAAQFDPLVTRRTSRKVQLMSESNYRFERGVDPVGVDAGSLRACQLILELAGGELAGGVIDVWAEPFRPRSVAVRPQRCDALLGTRIPVDRQVAILTSLGLEPKMEGDRIVCTIPSHRADLEREVDLIEEIARISGYEQIPVSPRVVHSVGRESPATRVRRIVSEALTGSGFDEAIHSSFVDLREAELFGCTAPTSVDRNVRKTNNVLRPTVLPSLLRACKTNQDAGTAEVRLFELASAFAPREGAEKQGERSELGMVATGELRDLRGALETLMGRIDPQASLSVKGRDVPGFASPQAGEVLIDGESVGVIGVIASDVLDYYGLNPERVFAGGAVRFDALVDLADRPRTYRPIAKFPPVQRDLSVVVDNEIKWDQLAAAIAGVDQPMRVGLDYVTTYRGKQIPSGKKSVTIQLIYRSEEGTLRSEEVDAQVDEVVSVLGKEFSAELRA